MYRIAIALVLAPALLIALPVFAGQPVNTIVVTTTADGLDNTDGACSLREAIRNANTNSAFSLLVGECPAGSATLTDVIVLTAGLSYHLTVAGGGDNAGDIDLYAQPSIPAGVPHLRIQSSIAGELATIWQMAAGERVIESHEAHVVLSDLRIRGGSTIDSGGGIYNREGELRMERVELVDNAALDGGGLYNAGIATLVHGDVLANRADVGHGGGIFNQPDAVLRLEGAAVTDNSARNGGGIANDGGTVHVLPGSHLSFNKAEGTGSNGNGGAIYSIAGGELMIDGAAFTTNEARQIVFDDGGRGGAIFSDSVPTLIVTNSLFVSNLARGDGGAIDAATPDPLTAHIVNSTFRQNRSQNGLGGAVKVLSRLECVRCDFEGNEARGGGAVRANSVGMRESRLLDNTANANGGAVSTQTLQFRDGSIIGNSVTSGLGGDGGAVWSQGQIILERCIVEGNSATGAGGAIHLTGQLFMLARIDNCLFRDNQSLTRGGAIFTRHGTRFTNTTISGNVAQEGGGVYIDEPSNSQMIHVTLANNLGDNLHKYGNLTTRNSLFSNPGGTNCVMGLDNPTLTSLGNNLSSDMSCVGLNPSDEVVDIEGLDALLAPLAHNGSPSMTHALLPTSPAIDAADSAACLANPVNALDQRGAPRPFGSACDIGAHEQGAEPPPAIFADGFEQP